MTKEILEDLFKAITQLEMEKAKVLAQTTLDQGVDPVETIHTAIRPALDFVGEKYQAGEIFLPELMIAAKTTEAAVAILEPALLKRGAQIGSGPKVIMATVKGDIHDIGKNIVTLLFKSAGFTVFDIGVDLDAETIIKKAKEVDADVIGLSAVLTTTMLRMKEFLDTLKEAGIRNRFKVIIGGAPVNQSYADSIGADGYAADAAGAVTLVKKLLSIN
jgi:corrinoid protein of di/trimethylamine methyltransferase